MSGLDGGTVNIKGYDGDIAQFGTDKDLVVKFTAETVLNAFKSQGAGAPIYDPVDMITVYHPGEPLHTPKRVVNELDKRRFRDQWQAYKENKEQKVEGTPLSVLFPHQPEIVHTLAAMHISTVQQLANITDTATQNMMFGFNLREKAQKYLAITEKSAEFHQIQKQLEDRDIQIKQLLEEVALLKVHPKPAEAPQTDQSAQIAALTQLVVGMQAQISKPKKVMGWPKGKPRKPREIPQEPTPAAEGEHHG